MMVCTCAMLTSAHCISLLCGPQILTSFSKNLIEPLPLSWQRVCCHHQIDRTTL